MILTKPCLQCGKTIIKQPSRSLKDWESRTKLCSVKCRYEWMRIFMRGNKNSLGKNTEPLSEETKRKISKSLWKGGKPKCEICQKIISYGYKRCKRHRIFTKEMRRNIGNGSRGEKCNFWKGGITPINRKIRGSLEYKIWREAVFKRDNYICRKCNMKGGELEADHIKQFAYFPKLRFKIKNGRTLCKKCHKKTKTHCRKIH